ncbi:Rid family detoxifying hydrolase [Aureibaculum sp. 2210JD6-5]|uniref:RidA family protein n=1 Tax=Aureibaculum sp. 2210JD6-5 TaxID=3103957 RepID=UPI002AACB023|nr:Rid family detoxifying hydrolase [Aureibaculum sp. 2210JD6-5]MDY7396161.1 Rid family detoxifying hydrolase [Aureibaculum sp. 2210JD6-5]
MKIKLVLFFNVFFLVGISSCTKPQTMELEFLKSKEEKKKDLPFSDAVRVGNILFLAGQIGMDHSTRKLVEGGIKQETSQALLNIKEVLESNGSDMSHIVKCTVILADINDFAAMNEVYKTFFEGNFPARTTFASSLVANAKIEIEATAVLK